MRKRRTVEVLRKSWLGCLALVGLVGTLLVSCAGDAGPLVPPGSVVVSDPTLAWVARIAWSEDGDELAFLAATSLHGDLRLFRASLTDEATTATESDDFLLLGQLRYVPGGKDLIVTAHPSVAPVVACGYKGVVVVRGAVAAAVVGCPFEQPSGVLGWAGDYAVDPDQFVAVHPAGTAVIVPTGNGAQWVDLVTFEARDLGAGFPVAFDPAGERVVVVESDPAAQAWAVVTVADGARTSLPIGEDRFWRGYEVIGVRWLAEGLVVLLERRLGNGYVWTRWNLDSGEERVLGAAREAVGALPLGRVPLWSASGRLLAFGEYECLLASRFGGCASPRWSIVVVDVETGERRLAYRGRDYASAPAIAPDDGAVAFALQGRIYVHAWR